MTDAPRALTVTEAMALAKRTLEGFSLRVMGEVSELTDRSGYKAVYFTLCDPSAVMSCLMWRDAYTDAGVPLREGLMVEVTGTLTVYPPKGRMQFQVRGLQAAGEGVLRLKVAALARRLEGEGLMRPERRRRLPEFPDRIGLVTSPRGKAVHDVLRTLSRRFPAAEVALAGVQVEGAGAPAAIVEGLRAAAASGVDVIVLARGGGSYEDLMPFNDESVARAIAGSPVPVVTGVGHEPDTTIADMVADLRASTPTAAAEAVSPACDEVEARLVTLQRLLGRGLLHAARTAARRVAVLRSHAVFRDPRAITATAAQRVDAAAAALPRGLRRTSREGDERVRLAAQGLRLGGRRALERAGETVASRAARLDDLSPLGILARGYAVCYAADGTVVRDAQAMGVADRVCVRVHRGEADCRVEAVRLEGDTP